MTTYYIIRLGSLVSRVVPLAVLYALAALAARAAYMLPTGARAAVRANIARVMRQSERSADVRRAAARVFRCQALNYVDLMRLDRVTPAELDATLVHGDLTPFVDALAAGKGGIIISGHVGNMDYVAQWLSLHGYNVHTVMEHLQPEKLHHLAMHQRANTGMRIHPAEPAAIGILTEALRRGAVVALLADRDVTGTGYEVDLFGAPARLPVGPALLGLRTGAPLIPAFGHRLSDDRLFVSVRTPVYLTRTRNLRADLHEAMRVVARLLEDGIAGAPDQWLVFEPIWPRGAQEGRLPERDPAEGCVPEGAA